MYIRSCMYVFFVSTVVTLHGAQVTHTMSAMPTYMFSPQTPKTPVKTPISDDIEDTQLFQAIEDGDLEEVKKLIAQGKDISKKGAEGESWLYFAAVFASPRVAPDIIAILRKAGVQPCEDFNHFMSGSFAPFKLPESAQPQQTT